MIPFQLHRRIPLVRRPFYQRDMARAECARLAAERDGLRRELADADAQQRSLRNELGNSLAEQNRIAAERDEAIKASLSEAPVTMRRLFGEQGSRDFPDMPFARTTGETDLDDRGLIERIATSYRLSTADTTYSPSDMWDHDFFKMKKDVHDALLADNHTLLQRMLRNPAETDLFYGFDNLARSLCYEGPGAAHSSIESYYDLICLAEAVGARRLWNVAFGKAVSPLPDVEPLLQSIDEALGLRIDFPNPFPGEIGLFTSRGVASYRAIQAVYQAHRIREIAGRGAKVLEIGAGLGRTAYYATKAGIPDYTIVDLPITNVAQGYFVGRALGEVCLFGEARSGVTVLPPQGFLSGKTRFDLIVNVDSLTEMARQTANSYCRKIKDCAPAFLSINHEHNQFTVCDACADLGLRRVSRTPYWLRRGYVEEVYQL